MTINQMTLSTDDVAQSNVIDILGIKIHATNLTLACQVIENWIKDQVRTYVCIAPVSTIIDCQENKEYREIINQAGMTTPDGMPLVWLGRLKGNAIMRRTYGPDLMLSLCDLSQKRGYRHYFYGGTVETNELLVKSLKNRFPELSIVGNFSPPFRNILKSEGDDVLDQINSVHPDVLWVGLGSPKQDFWMKKNRDKLNVPVMIGVGAAFDFLAGTKPQAPLWMRRVGLEWFFRFCCEPKRLWKRYLIGNSKFIYWIIKDFIRSGLKRNDT